MKEKRSCLICLLPVLMFICLPVSTAAVELDEMMGEVCHSGQNGNLEWLALAFSTVWALVLQIFRLRK